LKELEEKGYTPVHQRVETPEDFLAALRTRSWDAVISDYVLPQFSGPEALKLLRSHGYNIPFIMVSGVFGEEKAVAMMKAGANDYILKGNLSRLVPALERERETAQDRRLHKRAEGAMQYLAANVRELQHVIERAVTICGDNEMLESEHSGPAKNRSAAPTDVAIASGVVSSDDDFPTLRELEKQHIFAALDRCQGKRSRAAKLLDLSSRTLRNKLHKYKGT
jgi:DNA-binding NtrC family response regulator